MYSDFNLIDTIYSSKRNNLIKSIDYLINRYNISQNRKKFTSAAVKPNNISIDLFYCAECMK